MAAPGIVTYKTFTWRGAPEEWGNTYHFLGDAPSTPADWRSLVDDFLDLELLAVKTTVICTRAICYADTDSPSVYSYDLSAFGGTRGGAYNSGTEGSVVQEGGSAYMARWDTGRRSTKGKPIYLRKYWHPAMTESGDPDVIDGPLVTVVGTFALDVLSSSGAWPGLAGPDGVAPVGHLAETQATYRTLRKGRRRPT